MSIYLVSCWLSTPRVIFFFSELPFHNFVECLYLLGARNLDAPEKLKIFDNKIVKRSLKMKIKFNFVGKNKN